VQAHHCTQQLLFEADLTGQDNLFGLYQTFMLLE
jgi:hypothetical protein